ncbi:hypothetical protein SAE02_74150 [Skermanella aerolata]|uniref:Transposase n=1 Tax=Skermanella aerolata TaxID=393310 RepID=A0A512E3K0_9PROT|nr:transposase [Skermanella aerolata]KJB91302.1 hypothetical protein N826_31215 [Skermanella aerolata KACC 11604]GEO43267.1 hypothetical protein SAE02_74150 [Skermanella aerolata]
MTKSTRARYTLEFKEEAVRLVTGGERVATVARNLGLSEQTLHNWIKAAGNGGLKSSATPAVSAEQTLSWMSVPEDFINTWAARKCPTKTRDVSVTWPC